MIVAGSKIGTMSDEQLNRSEVVCAQRQRRGAWSHAQSSPATTVCSIMKGVQASNIYRDDDVRQTAVRLSHSRADVFISYELISYANLPSVPF
ncbi:hypothetical protein AVEN_167769-1 [Araneus ventricosus]|uniref:Uncharacterized protein n=1 Tax=Araneus ventricosus TaxID=182803 RepID=A0A4Y2J781_ARAVE|nr:hypothetical protein AVEN_167769-1 [Araneus ventricosus]